MGSPLLLLVPFMALLGDKKVEATCPIDGTRFEAIDPAPSYALGGVDRDHCPHPGTRPRLHHLAWTCPGCLFTGTKEDFEVRAGQDRVAPVTQVPADSKDRIRRALAENRALPVEFDQRELAGEIKFELLARVRELRGDPELEIGKAFLQAAWVVRQTGAPSPEEFDEYGDLRKRYGLDSLKRIMGKENVADLELQDVGRIDEDLAKGRLKGVKELLGRYLALQLLRKHGENLQAEERIRELEARRGENSVVDQAVETVRQSIGKEKAYLAKALERFRRAAGGSGYSGNDLLKLQYMIGELHRRLGEFEPAREWFDKTLAADRGREDQADFFKIVREQRARCE